MMIRIITKIRFMFAKNICCGRYSKIPISCRIIAEKGGTVKICKSLHAKRNITLHADSGNITIDNNVFLNEGCMIVSHEHIHICSNVKIGPYTCIYDHDHDYRNSNNEYRSKAVEIGEATWIGAQCIILSGAVIGSHCVIAAGSVVRGVIPDYSLFYNVKENSIISIPQ